MGFQRLCEEAFFSVLQYEDRARLMQQNKDSISDFQMITETEADTIICMYRSQCFQKGYYKKVQNKIFSNISF